MFINTEKSKTIEPLKCVLNLSQILDLRSSNKHENSWKLTKIQDNSIKTVSSK